MTFAKGEQGATLAIVLWILVALGALSFAAATAARIDLALARAWRDHAAALSLAEAGVADAMAAVAVERRTAGALEGGLSTGAYHVTWEPAGIGVRVVSTGIRAGSERSIEAWVADAGEGLHIAAWREIR